MGENDAHQGNVKHWARCDLDLLVSVSAPRRFWIPGDRDNGWEFSKQGLEGEVQSDFEKRENLDSRWLEGHLG